MGKTIGSFDLASLKKLRDDVTQYFWFESDSSSAWGSGAHVTLYPESQFTDSTNPNYMKGQNIIMNTDGFSIRNGALPMMVLDNDSLDFNAVNTSSGTYTTMATFGLSGMQIYSRNSNNNLVQLANVGYGPGTNSGGGISNAPYYTLGVRDESSPIYSGVGNYSVVEGDGNIANEYCSHAEGRYNASVGFCSHAEGSGGLAEGAESHTEGIGCHTKGLAAHAQNENTIASKRAQTALGVFNVEDTSSTTTHPSGISYYGEYAVIVGNGNSEGSRSNALTVDWSGNITINNHDSEIGHVYSDSKSVAISNTTIDHNTDGASLSLSAGVYIVVGQWHFNTRTTTGTTNSAIRLYRSGSSDNIAQTRVMAGDSNWNSLQCTAIVELTSTETIKVCGATSRPYTTAQGTYISAVRIK